MDRRTIIAVILSLAIYYAWVQYRMATAPPPPPEEAVTAPAPVPAPVVAPTPAAPVEIPVDAPPEKELAFGACGTRGTMSTAGGAWSDVVLDSWRAPYVVTPLYQWGFEWLRGKGGAWKPYGDDPGPAVLVSKDGEVFVAGAGEPDREHVRFAVVEDTGTRLRLAGTTSDGIAIERTLEEVHEGGTCTIAATVTWRNTTSAPYTGGTWVAMHDVVPVSHSRYTARRQPVAVIDGRLTYGGPTGSSCVREGTALGPDKLRIPVEGQVDWIGLSDRYFGIYVLPEPATNDTLTGTFTRLVRGETVLVDGTVLGNPTTLDPGASLTQAFTLYGGPNKLDLLKAADPRLTKAIDLGWSAFFAWPLLWLLRQFHWLLGNWGLAIILLTVLVKLVFFPLTQASFKSMRRMQAIQPMLQEIRKTYADNPEDMNRRTMALMSENQVNPLSGCLPQLVQIPVWLALYNALLSSVDLYQTRFLYLKDLSEPDPYLVLPVAITALMWGQQQLSTPAANMDPAQQQVMRWMPLIFGVLFFAFPSGLAVYVFVNVLLSIGQQWLINRSAGPVSLGKGPDADRTAAVG